MDDKSKKRKRYTEFVILSVIILTILSLNFSYSAFFKIKSGSTTKEISTGELKVTASATPMAKDDIYPTEEILPTLPDSKLKNTEKDFAPLIITNEGNIDANFVVSLSYDLTALSPDQIANDLVSFENLIIGVYDVDKTSWLNLNPGEGDPIYSMKVTGFSPTEESVYPIFSGEIEKAKIIETGTDPTVRNLRVYVWLADTTPISEIGKLVHLKLDVRSMPLKGQEEKEITLNNS